MFIKQKIRNNKQLIESFLSLSVLNGLNVLLPLITLPYTLRVIGTANYGIYSYVYVIIQYLLLITAFGFNYSATKQVSQFRNDFNAVNNIYKCIFICRSILLLIGIALCYILSPLLFDADKVKIQMFTMGIGMVIGDIFNPTWLFQGMEKMRYLTIVNFFAKLVFTVLIFVLIRDQDDFIYLILLNSLGYLVGGLLSTILAIKYFKVRLGIPNWSFVKFQFSEGLSVFGSAIGINLYKNTSIVILNFFTNDSTVGIFAAADKIIKGLQLLGSPISQALFPHLGYKFCHMTEKEAIYNLLKVSKPFVLLLSLFAFITFLFSNQLVDIICGSEYVEAAIVVKIMSPILILGGLNSLFGFSGLINLNYKKTFFLSVLITGILTVIFSIIFSCIWGVYGIAIVSTFSELFLLILIGISLFKIVQKKGR